MPKKPRPRSSDSDPSDRAWADYTASFRKHVLPGLVHSSYMISLGETVNWETLDLRAATELGLMLLLDKPLIIAVLPGQQISAALRRAATVTLDNFDITDPATQDRLAEVLRTFPKGGPDGPRSDL